MFHLNGYQKMMCFGKGERERRGKDIFKAYMFCTTRIYRSRGWSGYVVA